MKYLPWDRLQIKSDFDGGQRVYKNEVFYKLYRSYAQKTVWSPLFLKNGALFYGGLKSEVTELVSNIASQNKQFNSSSTVRFYNFNEDFKKEIEGLESKRNSFYYHPYEAGLNVFLDDILIYRNSVKETISDLNLTDSVNKRIDLIIINFNSIMVKEIKENKETLNKLLDLLENSERERVYPFLIFDKVAGSPSDLMRKIEWMAFLGNENTELAEKVFRKLEKGYRSINQILIGSCYSINNKRLLPLHPLKFEASEWWTKKKETLEEEDIDYEKYLDSLDDRT